MMLIVCFRNKCKGTSVVSAALPPNQLPEMNDFNDQLYFQDDDDDLIENRENDENRRDVDEKLGKFFLGCSISFRTVESQLFHDFCKALQNYKKDYNPPCRRTLAGPILGKIHEQVKKKRKCDLQETEGVLMLDDWKNKVTNQELTVCTVSNKNVSQTFLHAKDTSEQKKTSEMLATII